MTTPYDYYCPEPVEDTTILFKELVLQHSDDIKSYMNWENYTLNTTVIPLVDSLKDHALVVLMNSYGLFSVDPNILEPFLADVFIYFPLLMQQLAITRLVDAFAVGQTDTDTVETTRTDTLAATIDQNSTMTAGTSVSDVNVLNTTQKTTGTIGVENDTTNTQDSTTTIDNTSGVESTGTRNINLNHNMPEQSIDGVTGNLPSDPQGTPELTTSYIQTAAASYSTSNPVNTTENSNQHILNTNTGNNNSTTTNDVSVADTGNTTRTTTNSGTDNDTSLTKNDSTNTTTELITSHLTNKQYSYEIKAFLETADSLVAFSRWEDRFSWVVGIL
jgi:hypothetical protein